MLKSCFITVRITSVTVGCKSRSMLKSSKKLVRCGSWDYFVIEQLYVGNAGVPNGNWADGVLPFLFLMPSTNSHCKLYRRLCNNTNTQQILCKKSQNHYLSESLISCKCSHYINWVMMPLSIWGRKISICLMFWYYLERSESFPIQEHPLGFQQADILTGTSV